MDEKAQNIYIPLKGLQKGGHSFTFAIDGEFFQTFGNTQIKDAGCTVKADVIRRSTLMSVQCMVGGFVVVECDRCLEDLTLQVDVERELTVGFGNVDIDDAGDEEDVIVVSEGDDMVDISQFIYDYICLSLPIVKVHPEGKCNPEMLKRLAGSAEDVKSEESGNNPFSGLKDLLKK